MGIINKPEATSTPTTLPVLKGRRCIRDHNSIQSPIETSGEFWQDNLPTRSMKASPTKSPSRSPRGSPYYVPERSLPGNISEGAVDETESSQNDSDEPRDKYSHDRRRLARQREEVEGSCFRVIVFISLGVAVLAGLLTTLYYARDDSLSDATPQDLFIIFKPIEQKFRNQNEDFWSSIRVSVQEVTVLDQPRSIIFLYENRAKATMEGILNSASSAALCHFGSCWNEPVVIQGSSLNSTEILNDYGRIISRYRSNLEKNGVMIVKNLEQVPGLAAQAFHSFCDDYNPVVKKALILFTMKVEKLPEGYPMLFLEKVLMNLWKELGRDDKFYPLFTRISGTVLSVQPE